MATPINGTTLAQRLEDDIRAEVARFGTIAPGLAAVLVGSDPASHLYVSLKEKACARVGIRFEKVSLPDTASQRDVMAALADLNGRADIDGILLQLPLPAGLDTNAIVAAIDPAKDVDGFHPHSIAAFARGAGQPPVLIAAILTLIAETGVSLEGKTATVIGKSDVFLSPLAAALKSAGCKDAITVHPEDPQLPRLARAAHVLVAAAGRPHSITPDLVRPGAIVIDVGTTRVEEKTLGDVDPAVDSVAGWRSPVPGGVGPVTIAMVLSHLVKLAEARAAR